MKLIHLRRYVAYPVPVPIHCIVNWRGEEEAKKLPAEERRRIKIRKDLRFGSLSPSLVPANLTETSSSVSSFRPPIDSDPNTAAGRLIFYWEVQGQSRLLLPPFAYSRSASLFRLTVCCITWLVWFDAGDWFVSWGRCSFASALGFDLLDCSGNFLYLRFLIASVSVP